MSVSKIVLSGLTLLAISVPACAGDNMDTGWYMGLSAVQAGRQSEGKVSGYHLLGGYAFNKYVALEAGYLGVFDGGTGQVRVVGTLPVNDQFFVNAKLGTFVRDHETPNTTNLGLGLGYNLNPSTSLRIDWDRSQYKARGIGVDIYSVGMAFKF